jgi:hypothetical protein
MWWWWYFHWEAVGDLSGFCASHGDGAKMVLEVIVPRNSSPSATLPECTGDEILLGGTRACVVPNSYRFEVDCTAGGLLFELPSDQSFTGYYHVESAQVPAAARRMVLQDAACVRDVSVGSSQDGSMDAGSSDGPTQDGSMDVETTDGPTRDGSMDAETADGLTSEVGQGCWASGTGIPTGGSCGAIVTHCTSVWTGDCADDALAQAVNPIIHACGGSCGVLSVGLSGGCVTIVQGLANLPGSIGSRLDDGAASCIERYLMDHRFDCVPSDGWVALIVDGCLLPGEAS